MPTLCSGARSRETTLLPTQLALELGAAEQRQHGGTAEQIHSRKLCRQPSSYGCKLVALRGASTVPRECICSSLCLLGDSCTVFQRVRSAQNLRKDKWGRWCILSWEIWTLLEKKRKKEIIPWKVSPNEQRQQEGNKMPGCKKELNWKYTKKVLQNPCTKHTTTLL